MAEEPLAELLRDVRRELADAEAEISEAVSAINGQDTGAEELLATAMTRLKVLDQRVRRALDEP